jgi:hypothetical protein
MARGLSAGAYLVVVAATLSAGCAATFRDPTVAAGQTRTKWAHHYFIGAVGEAEIDVRDHCPTARAHEVWVGEDVFTLGVSILTLGIYTPRKVAITCAAPSAGSPAP